MTVSGVSSTLVQVKGILLGSACCFLFPSLLVYSTKFLFAVSENLASSIRTQLINSLLFRFYRIQLPTPSDMKLFFVEPAICLSAFAMTLTSPLTTQYVYRRIWEETGNYSMDAESNVSECEKNKSSPVFAFQEVRN